MSRLRKTIATCLCVALIAPAVLAIQEDTATRQSCMRGAFSHTGTEYWKNVTLTVTNACDALANLDGVVIRFQESQAIGDIWYTGNGHTAYPDIAMTSEADRHSAVLRFANGSAREQTTLLPGQSVSLQYGTPTVGYDPATVSIAEAPARLPKRVPPAPVVAAPRQDPAPTSSTAPAPDLRIERVIGYLPLNWNNSGAYSDSIPRPSELKRAGYTHILIAFGIFSTDPHCADTASCVLLSARDGAGAKISSGDGTERRPLEEYVAELKTQGIRVLLSIGGASSHFGTVDFEASFRQVQNGTLDFRRTVNAFVDSLTHLIDRYGFDGVDIDIEVGLSAPRSTDLRAAGSVQTCERRFTRASGLSPDSGSVCALTAVLRTLLQRDPELLLSLAPQTLNIAANHQIGGSVMNYAALIANTRDLISWVGIQVYNSGGMYDPDGTLTPITAANQVAASVAMARNLLERWNQERPYVFVDNQSALLAPHQVVLGYPATNGRRADGRPAGAPDRIHSALRCLQHRLACAGAAPRKNLSGPIGGVFSWNVNFDRAAGYAFARSMTSP